MALMLLQFLFQPHHGHINTIYINKNITTITFSTDSLQVN